MADWESEAEKDPKGHEHGSRVTSKHANSVGMRLVGDLTWVTRDVQELAREMKKLEEGAFIPGWGNLIFSKDMLTHKKIRDIYVRPVGVSGKEKGI